MTAPRALVLALALALGLLACASPRAQGDGGGALPLNQELLREGDRLMSSRKYADAKHAYARAAEASGPVSGKVEACAQVARMELVLGQSAEGEPWLAMARALARRDEPLGWSRLQQVLGIYEREAGQDEAAVKRFRALYDYCIEHELYRRAFDAAHWVVLASPDPAEQEAWTRKGIEAAARHGDQAWLAVLWNNFGASLEERGRYRDALAAYQEARRYHDATGDEHAKQVAAWAVGHAQRLCGELAAARATLTPVLAWAERAHAAAPGPETLEWLGWVAWDLGELDLASGDEARGRERLERARAALVEAGIERWTPAAYFQGKLAELDARLESLGAARP
ncbi:MAG: hypothetical protein H6828_10090 [Planctomycetes bacterium]|nr:hypothetical protein [Planctomycetota bacterium]